MTERSAAITFKGNPMTLIGDEIKVGDTLPDFKLVGAGLAEVANAQFAGKVLVISVVPSIDTPVCATQTKQFNQEAGGLGDDVAILTVSVDLPMAQGRFCGAEGVENITMASDFRDHAFGVAFGVRIKELGLLTRAVFVAGKDGKVVHAQTVPEVVNEPDYDAVMQAVRAAL